MNLIDRINTVLNISNDSKLAEKLSKISGKKIDKSRVSKWRNKGFFGSTKVLLLLIIDELEKSQATLKESTPIPPKDGTLVLDADTNLALRYVAKTNTWKPICECCEIFGSEIQFDLVVLPEEIFEKCHHIWEHPSDYSDYKDNSEDAYYKFLKFLWVRFPDGKEERLCDIANTVEK